MLKLRSVLNSPAFFWALLALPATGMIAQAFAAVPNYERLLHPTGEFSARFLIILMMITPLRMIFPTSSALLWLNRRRRYLGVASFGYAALHTLYYILDKGSFSAIAAEAFELGIWTGWLAFIIYIPLAATSNDASLQWLRRKWKPLQRTTYIAAIAILAHWVFVHNEFGAALVHVTPLVLLEAYRVWKNFSSSTGHKIAAA